MSTTDLAIPDSTHTTRFEASLAAEQEVERGIWITIAKTILVSIPLMIGIFVLITAIAISDKTEWYVWLGLGVAFGVIGACLLGSLAGATISAHRLDAVDRAVYD
jgi:hypothetical protein